MTITRLLRPAPLTWVAIALAAALCSANAYAADKAAAAEARALHQKEVAVCNSGQSNQDRVTCLYEADSAYAQDQRGGLDDGRAAYGSNATQRCQALRGDERRACSARMQGQGTTSGTAAEGGIYRELVTREAVLPATPQAGPNTSAPR
jgi:hypothetical protein